MATRVTICQLVIVMLYVKCCQTCNEVSTLSVTYMRPEVIDMCTPVTRTFKTHVILSNSMAVEKSQDAPCTCRIALPAHTQLKVKTELVAKDETRDARSCDQAMVVQDESGEDLCTLCEPSNQDIIQCSDQTRTIFVKYTTTDSTIKTEIRASFLVSPASWFALECGLAPPGEPSLKQGPSWQTPTLFTTSPHPTHWTRRIIRTTSFYRPTPSSSTSTVFSTSTPANIHHTVPVTSTAASSPNRLQSTLATASTMTPSRSTTRVLTTTLRVPNLDNSRNNNEGSLISSHVRDILRSKGFIVGVILGGNAMILIMIATTIISCRSHKKKLNMMKRYGSQHLILEGSTIGDSSDGCPPGSSEYGSVFHVTASGSNDYAFSY